MTTTRLLLAALILCAGGALTGPAAALDAALPGLADGLAGIDVAPPISTIVATPTDTGAGATQELGGDLLGHIAANFELQDADERRVAQEYRWYANHPDYLDRVFARAERYLPYIVGEIERRQMPIDLALLPVVESAFDPFAYSHGRAAGLWQFIPSTGRLYGLEQNWWYDGRRDVVASTNAALDYLTHLHRKTGDWLLAIASYNSGEGRVLGAVRRNRKAGRPTDFWHLKLPRETRTYVPKLLAITRIVRDRYELDTVLPLISHEPFFAVAELDGQIDLALAAEFAGTTIEEIYRLNPGFNRWATPPSGPHRLVVPIAALTGFRSQLAATPLDRRVRWDRYQIQSGDALSTIAKKHGTTTDVLRDANGLRGSTIRAGSYLMIPSASRDLANYPLSVDGRQQRRLKRNDGTRYTVQSGDSFWSIGRRFGVGTRQLARWNGMAPGDTLRAGRELIVHGARASITAAPVTAASGPGDARRRVAYVVRRGDSLARISSRFRVTVRDLENWNKLDRNNYLQPGQRLVMYIDVTRQSGG